MKYKDKVKIISGFYEWKEWTLIDEYKQLIWLHKWVEKYKFSYWVIIDGKSAVIAKEDLEIAK